MANTVFRTITDGLPTIQPKTTPNAEPVALNNQPLRLPVVSHVPVNKKQALNISIP